MSSVYHTRGEPSFSGRPTVPTLIAFSYFSKRVEVMSVEMETLVVDLINKCYYGRSSREVISTKSLPPVTMPPTIPSPIV